MFREIFTEGCSKGKVYKALIYSLNSRWDAQLQDPLAKGENILLATVINALEKGKNQCAIDAVQDAMDRGTGRDKIKFGVILDTLQLEINGKIG